MKLLVNLLIYSNSKLYRNEINNQFELFPLREGVCRMVNGECMYVCE